jgi:hypothetical protein
MSFSVSAQISINDDLNFELRGNYKRGVKKENLLKVNRICDVIEGFPVNWINDYLSIEIEVICNGKKLNAINKTDVLNKEQLNLLNSADLNSNIKIKVDYKYIDFCTKEVELNTMNVLLTVVPEVEAEFIGGVEQQTNFITEHIIDKISHSIPKELKQIKVLLTIDERGEIANLSIDKTSGDSNFDKQLMEELKKFPKWKPAENNKGEKVKQIWEFILFLKSSQGC